MNTAFVHLRVNGLRSPLGVSGPSLRFTWVLNQQPRAGDTFSVTAAATLPNLLAGEALIIDAAGIDPTRREHLADPPTGRLVYWRVGLCRAETVSWSEPEFFTTAPDLDGLGAGWITHPQVVGGWPRDDSRTIWFATTIQTLPTDTVTLAHIAAPGVVELRVDSRPVAGSILGPGYGELRHEAPAATYNLGRLSPGSHLVTIEFASGPFWIPDRSDRYAKFTVAAQAPMLRAAIEQLGETTRVTASGPSFQTGRGATAAHWYGGEDYDAGGPEPWSLADSEPVVPAALTHAPNIRWAQFPPIAITEVLTPRQTHTGVGAVVCDFGVNIAGVPELGWDSADLPRTITLRPSEILHDHAIDQISTGTPIFDTIQIPAGSAGRWRPRFSYHGFRYLEVRGSQQPELSVAALVMRAANSPAGTFTSSDAFLASLHLVVDRAVQGNMYSVFTDCPHREKLGWLEQLHLCFDALVRNYDVEAHLRDVMHHVRVAQLPSGAIPSIAPEFVDFTGVGFLGDHNAFRFDVNWGGAMVLVPLYHYRQYGDARVLHENLPAMRRYLGHLATIEEEGTLDFGLGDWIAVRQTAPRRLVATYGYLRVLRAAVEVARLVGDVTWLAELRSRVRAVSDALRQFDDPATDAGQTELALLVDLADTRADDETAERLFARLLDRIVIDGGAFTVGEVAFEPLVNSLHRRGLDELVYRTISQPDLPGYGMQLAAGVTALAETWSARGEASGEGSNNHFMLGMIDHWLHKDVAGLRQADGSIAWRRAVVEPVFLPDVCSAGSTHDSPMGRYGAHWTREPDHIVLTVEVPNGGQAAVRVRGLAPQDVGHGVHTFRVHPGEVDAPTSLAVPSAVREESW